MRTWHYFHHNLKVCSELYLPEWACFETNPCESDVTIRVGETVGESAPAQRQYTVPVDRIGCFLIRDGREIVLIPECLAGDGGIERDSNAPEARRMRAFLLGAAWGAILYQRGELLLHASAIGTVTGAVAFCARRGAGKSTLAACLADRGYPLVSDDLSVIQMESDGIPQVLPSVPRFKLCRDAADMLGWDRAGADQLPSGKYYYPSVIADSQRRYRLHRIYLLAWGIPSIQRIRGFDALSRLTSAGTWRGDMLIETGDPAVHFGRCAELLRNVECWEFRRPRDFNSLSEQIDTLMSHLAGI